jgi:hypothetical protein
VNGHKLERRAWVARVFVGAAVVLTAGAVLLAGRGPAVAADHRPAGPSLLTARSAGGHDALWLVSPAGGPATAAGTLPGLAGSAAVAPDGANVAYLPASGKPQVWLGYGVLAPKTISLASAGLKWVGGMTWIGADRLLVSASTNRRYFDLHTARLYTVNATTGAVTAFRGLAGAEPSADVASGKVAYVRFAKLDGGSASNGHAPLYRESLKLLSLRGSGAGRTLSSEQYRPAADQRAFSQPQLAPGGAWVLTGVTGSDVRVTYRLFDTGDIAMPWLTVFAPTLQAAAWTPDGGRVAFGGVTPSPDTFSDSCVYVDDVTSGALTRSPAGVMSGASAGMITGLAWSDDGRLVADALDNGTGTARQHVLVMRGDDLGAVTDLGAGHLSVWVP